MFEHLRRLLIIALMSGSVAGFVSWGAHMAATNPLILRAETYEATTEANLESGLAAQTSEGHDDAGQHSHTAFVPEDGWERNLFTLGADILTGIGFAMLMVAGFALSGDGINLRRGLLWGFAGFAAFTLAPALGLPPELPGTEAAPLVNRQIWWAFTGAATIAGIVACVKARRPAVWLAGLGIIALPHIVGAPAPTEHSSTAPEELRNLFVWVAMASGLVFWLSLGAVAGAAYRRLSGSA